MIVLAALSLWAAVSDARARIIPNLSCLLIAACGLALQAVRVGAPGALVWLPWTARVAATLPVPASCVAWAAGMLVGGVVLELAVRRYAGMRGLGLGDVKFVSAWATVLGRRVLLGLALACLAGALCAAVRHRRTFPLAPWLTLAFLAILVCV